VTSEIVEPANPDQASRPEAPELAPYSQAFRGPPPRPILGPALWILGVLLWGYVVVGELVVGMGLQEELGVGVLVLSVGMAAYASTKRSLLSFPPAPEDRSLRVWGPLGVALGLFIATLMLLTLVARSSTRELDEEITLVLWCASLMPLIASRELMRRGRASPTPGRRVLGWMLWLLTGIVTLVALGHVMEGM